ncbi:nuclear transport factor 2 family protein [Sulfurimonas sp.]|jgi:hypothetical protein|uniref:nuclear transport factor 2 family protein n=1 Tax=Sulfurimonas sp. TaxID=2022749 RepID=UPI002600703C|nr:nuclear transport factor 2 family protein [Sulfurimonas sp.]MBT5934038.1 nuclear transport factor 2 family protein [Sulfurimonas sp.]
MNSAQKYADFFETINSKTPLEEYKEFFDENSYFEDPFQKVTGVVKIYNIFEDMYIKLFNPRFEIYEVVSNENISYIKWKFLYQVNEKSSVDSFIGISRIELSDDGKVMEHVDYWDAGSNIYEKIPLLGSIIRYIKSKIHV